MSMCTGKPHADGKPCRGVQTIPAECFVCGVMDHQGLNVYYDPDHLPHWQCRPCAGGYWWRVSDDRKWTLVFHGWEDLVAQFRDDDEADDYVTWLNDNLT